MMSNSEAIKHLKNLLSSLRLQYESVGGRKTGKNHALKMIHSLTLAIASLQGNWRCAKESPPPVNGSYLVSTLAGQVYVAEYS